jgi:hypothetical protein
MDAREYRRQARLLLRKKALDRRARSKVVVTKGVPRLPQAKPAANPISPDQMKMFSNDNPGTTSPAPSTPCPPKPVTVKRGCNRCRRNQQK